MLSLANIAKVRVCSICTKKIEGDATECEDGHLAQRPNKEDSYFIELPLEPQLKMITEENLSDIFGGCRKQVLECTEEASSYKDITDGTLYKNFYKEVHSESGDRTCCHLSLMISTDGAPVFKSIHCSIWRLYLCILELPSQRRFVY
ncbi:uncharacterized protein LOC122951448 [Acropora millepora]|uniref:uncharacterized protein LOC122951448 n=1 Tax=Acropora millepora TaxID=45264 RepID=UPI001CF22F1B|nr:uncharacterized protein LOC122951448 [Acropora millepora]